MTSQLANQLKALAANSATASGTSSSSSSTVRHPSLLFSPAVASDTSVDSIYHLAVNGLTQLASLQPALLPFASSLFHPATLTLDRAAQKPDVQAQLDKSVTSFVTRLAPYFLHPPAAQSLEWLVRRYEVHRYNVDVLVEQLLCWHQSELFRRLLALLKLPANHFLAAVQTAGVTVDRHTIVTAARLDAGVWEMVARVTKAQQHNAQLGLYVTVGIELLSSQKASEQLLTATVPHLLHGLRLATHHSLNYHAATLMLLVSVCDAHVLDTEVVRALLAALTAPLTRDTSALSATINSLAAVVSSQRVERLEAEVVDALVHAKGVVSVLSEVTKAREGEVLLCALLLSIVHELVENAVSQASSALFSPSLTAAATPTPTSPALAPLSINTPAVGETTTAATGGRTRASFNELLSFLRQVTANLSPRSTVLASTLLTELFDQSVAAAARNSNQLPVRLLTAIREVFESVEQSVGRQLVDEWITQRKAGRTERETRRDLTDWTASGHAQEDETAATKKRKTQDGASGEAIEAEAEESLDEVADDRRERKRRRTRNRRSVLQLGQSDAAVGSHLLAHVTKGTRHAFSIARDGESNEDGAMRLSVWQSVWSEDEDERQRGLSALQKLQKVASNEKDNEGKRPQFSLEQVESIVDDTLHSDNPTLIQHLLSLTSLLLSIPSDSLTPTLLQLLDRHTTALAADTAGTGSLGVAHRKEQQRANRAILAATVTFLTTTFLPAHPELLPTFLPFYLEHAMIHKSTAKLNSHVRSSLSSLHRLSPLLLHLPSTVQFANNSSAETSVEDDNQRLVELMSKNVIKDNSSNQQLLQLLLEVMDGVQGRGVLAAGLVLNLVFELRSEKGGMAATRRGKGKGVMEDSELRHLRRFFTAVSMHLHRLSATSVADASDAEPPASYFSALPTALRAFLRYLLDRLIVTLPPLSTVDNVDVGSSTAAQLIYDVVTFLLSAPSPTSARLYHAHIAHLLSRHLPSFTAQLDLIARCVLPSRSSSTPLLVSVRAVQLLSSLLSATTTDSSAVLSAIPLALCAMGHWSRSVRQAALALVDAIQEALQTADKANTKAHAAHQLMSVILAEREECVSDPRVLHRLMGSFFTPHSSLSSLSTAATASFARSLLSPASTSSHRPVTAALLAVMERVPAVYVLDVADVLLSGVVDDAGADDVSVSVASHVLSHLTAEAMAASERGTGWFVALLTRALASPVTAVQRLVLSSVTPALLTALPAAEQSTLFNVVLGFHFKAATPALRDLASSTLRALPISASVYVPALEEAQTQLARGETDALSGMLDLVSASPSLSHSHLLCRPLMAALHSLRQLETSSDSVQYTEQTVLSCLLQLLPRLRVADVKAAHFDLHLLVSCLTATQDSSAAMQTRNTALQLLSSLAPLLPAVMADVVEPLVTQLTAVPFTSTDSYSFSLVQRAIEQILPPLLPARPTTDSAALPLARRLLATLVNSVTLDASTAAAVLELLCVLVRTVGSAYLHDVLQLLVRRSVQEEADSSRLSEKRAKRREEKKKRKATAVASNPPKDDEATAPFDHTAFAHSLLDQFTPLEQAREMSQVLSTTLLIASASDSAVQAELSLPFSSDDEQRGWTLRALLFVSSHLVHLPFVSSLLDLSEAESAAVHAQYEPMFTSLFALHTNNTQQLHAVTAADTGVHYRALEAGLQSALSHLTNLLSVSSFVRLSSSLLMNADSSVPKQAMVLLQSKLTWLAAQHQDRAANATTGQQAAVELSVEQERDGLTTLVTPLSKLISFEQSEQLAQQKDQVATAQLALACLQSLVITVSVPLPFRSQSDVAATHMASRRQQLLAVLPAVLSHFESSSTALSSSALLCAAAMIDQLRVAVLPHLPTFLPRALAIALQAATSTTSKNTAALLSALTVINVSIEQLPAFISPYLPALLTLFMQPSLHNSTASVDASSLISSSVASLIALLTPDTLLPHLTTAYKSAVKLGSSSLTFFFSALAQLVSRLSPDLTRQHLKPLFRLYQVGFTLRTTASAPLTSSELDVVEDAIVDGYLQLTLKLTEQQMKACLLRLIDWVGPVEADVAAAGEAAAASKRSTAFVASGGLDRGLVLFKVVGVMAERLKSIFVPYYAFVFDHAMAYLTAADSMQSRAQDTDQDVDEEDEEQDEDADDEERADKRPTAASLALYNQLVSLILSSLRTALSHDTQHFFGKEHLDRLVPTLATLLPATYHTSPDTYNHWVSTYYTPLCVQLCLTLSHFHHWKPLHSALLTVSRSPVAAVRVAVVECVSALFEALQSRYLVMLPETLPFVSEWLEDEEEEVERKVQRLVKVIEELSGEKLDRYLEG